MFSFGSRPYYSVFKKSSIGDIPYQAASGMVRYHLIEYLDCKIINMNSHSESDFIQKYNALNLKPGIRYL